MPQPQGHPPDELPDELPDEPLALAVEWLAWATRARLQPNPNAMVLATADARGRPSARVVLCKDIQPQIGCVTFFSNYGSRKGAELSANPYAAAVMHWDSWRRQIRLEGPVTRSSDAESDAYFAARPWQSRIGAWASDQSAPIGSRALLEQAIERTARRFGVPSPSDVQGDAAAADPGVPIPRPPHWGGYHLWPETVELWVEGTARLHDRARWTRPLERQAAGFRGGHWLATRLQP